MSGPVNGVLSWHFECPETRRAGTIWCGRGTSPKGVTKPNLCSYSWCFVFPFSFPFLPPRGDGETLSVVPRGRSRGHRSIGPTQRQPPTDRNILEVVVGAGDVCPTVVVGTGSGRSRTVGFYRGLYGTPVLVGVDSRGPDLCLSKVSGPRRRRTEGETSTFLRTKPCRDGSQCDVHYTPQTRL